MKRRDLENKSVRFGSDSHHDGAQSTTSEGDPLAESRTNPDQLRERK